MWGGGALTHCGRPAIGVSFEAEESKCGRGGTYNATDTAESVDTNLGDHDCGSLNLGAVSEVLMMRGVWQ